MGFGEIREVGVAFFTHGLGKGRKSFTSFPAFRRSSAPIGATCGAFPSIWTPVGDLFHVGQGS